MNKPQHLPTETHLAFLEAGMRTGGLGLLGAINAHIVSEVAKVTKKDGGK
jgi:hypothetical protein